MRIELNAPLQDEAVVRVRICWVRPLPTSECEVGAVIRESDRGWLGHEE